MRSDLLRPVRAGMPEEAMTDPAAAGLWPADQRPPSHPVALSDAEAVAVLVAALEKIWRGGTGASGRASHRRIALEALAKVRGDR